MENINKINRALDRLTDELDKEGIKILLESLIEVQSQVSEEFIKLANARSIDESSGEWLDYIGEIFNVKREGLNDEDYREAIRFKISVNNADGTPNIMIDLIKNFTESLSVEIRDSGIAFATIQLNGQSNISSELYKLLQSIKPVGTRYIIHSDFFNNCFRLAYETSNPSVSALNITLDGVVFENILVTLDGINYEPLFITEGQDLSYYNRSLYDNKNSFYYEDPPFLMVTLDGVNYEPLILNTGLEEERLRVVTPYLEDYIPNNILPLTWEVWENSKKLLPL